MSRLFVIFAVAFISSAQSMGAELNNIKVMAYNVENLFDWTDNAGKKDETYLPLQEKQTEEHKKLCKKNNPTNKTYLQECLELDWSPSIVKEKLTRIADTITQESPEGPDIVIIEEVENNNVLRMLNRKLPLSHYTSQVLIEGPDERGVDVGMLSRFPVKNKKLHLLSIPNFKTRGILQVDFTLPNGQILTVFGVHFPSQSNPVQRRRVAVQTLNQLMSELPEDRLVVAGGDFNISKEEEKKQNFFSQDFEKLWDVSQLHSTSGCPGSYYHSGWAFLDALLIKKMDSSVYTPLWDTFRALRQGKYQLLNNGRPARFDYENHAGVSDHLPVYGEISVRNNSVGD